MRDRTLLILPALLALLGSCAAPAVTDAVSSPTRKSLWAERHDDRLTIRYGDEPFAEYVFRGAAVPYLYPLVGPGGVPVTRGYPMEERPGEARDHPHHRSAWFAHGDVNGVDFWHPEAENGGTIEHTGRLTEVLERGKNLRTRLELLWKDRQGAALLRERRTVTFRVEEDHRSVDFVLELTAESGDVTFGDTKEGTFALRLHPELRLAGELANGRAFNAEGVEGEAVWGERAAWLSYQGKVGGRPVGVAIFDHSDNLRHPAWWHARPYGLFAANPFGRRAFEGAEAEAGDHVLKEGETLVLRYRIWIHAGEKTPEELDAMFAVYDEQAKGA